MENLLAKLTVADLIQLANLPVEELLHLPIKELFERDPSACTLLSISSSKSRCTRKAAFKKLAELDCLPTAEYKSLFDKEPRSGIRDIILPMAIEDPCFSTLGLFDIACYNKRLYCRVLAIKQLAKRELLTSDGIKTLVQHADWQTAVAAIKYLCLHPNMELETLLNYAKDVGSRKGCEEKRIAAIDAIVKIAKACQEEALLVEESTNK